MAKKAEEAAAVRQAILGPASAGVLSTTTDRKQIGEYEVVASIGKGGMGEIFLARMPKLRAKVEFIALKVLLEEVQGDDDIIAMFADEAAIMERIDHDNVLRVYDFGHQGDAFFLAMEYLEGRPLVRVMIDAYAGGLGLDYQIVAAVGAGAARGLHAAHRAKTKSGEPLEVIHRDVSPQNIFVTYDGVPKVIDFGVARASQRLAKTVAGQLKGKAAYMSPEQVSGKPIDQRSDVFSLGACLWEMAAGRRLFRRGSDFETMAAVTDGPIVPPSELRGNPDPEFDSIVLRALRRDPSERTPTSEELERDLLGYARRRGFQSGPGPLIALMDRLYGGEAKEERALIEQLKSRIATEEEAWALRNLSGIAPSRGMARHITLLGRPLELDALESFGEVETFNSDEPDHEARTVQFDAAKHNYELAADGEDSDLYDPSDEHLATFTTDTDAANPSDDPVELGAATQLMTSPGARRPSVKIGASISEDEATEEASNIEGAVQALSAQIASQSVLKVKRPERLTIAPRNETRAPSRVPVLVGAAALVILGVAAAVYLTAPKTKTKAGEPPGEAAPTPTVGATPDEVRPRAAAKDTPNVPIERIKSRGVGVQLDAGHYTFLDQDDGRLVVGEDARFTMVDTETSQGWLVHSNSAEGARAGFIGRVRGGPWRARALTINNCKGHAEATSLNIQLAYQGKVLALPEGGGPLHRVELERPKWANRLEVRPLEVAFGKQDERRPGDHCDGWADDIVVLHRVPPGAYSLMWLGGSDKYQEVEFKLRSGSPPIVKVAAKPYKRSKR